MPTLILSGAQDLRTPIANAREVAASIPDAQLVVVPYTGHSVLGDEVGDCAELAVDAFFGGAKVQSCRKTSNPFPPTAAVPGSFAAVTPIHGLRGVPGRTVSASLEAISYLQSETIGAILEDGELKGGASFGGLRSGYATLKGQTMRLHAYSFVTGVTLTGTLYLSGTVISPKLSATHIVLGGSAEAKGYLRLSRSGRVSGVLDGVGFSLHEHETTATAADAEPASADSIGSLPFGAFGSGTSSAIAAGGLGAEPR